MPRGAVVQSPRPLALGYEADTLRSGRFADDLSPPRRNAAARDFLDESSLSSSSSGADPTLRRISAAHDSFGGHGTSSSSDETGRPPLRPTAARREPMPVRERLRGAHHAVKRQLVGGVGRTKAPAPSARKTPEERQLELAMEQLFSGLQSRDAARQAFRSAHIGSSTKHHDDPLTVKELNRWLQAVGVNLEERQLSLVMASVDSDGDGSMSWEEFLSAVWQWKLTALRRRLWAASYSNGVRDLAQLFRHYDRDNDGNLSFEEFRRAVRKDAKVTEASMPDEDLRELFDDVDESGDGAIDLAEFVELLTGESSMRPYATVDYRETRRESKRRELREREREERPVVRARADPAEERRRQRVFDQLAKPTPKHPSSATLHEAVSAHKFRSPLPDKARGKSLHRVGSSGRTRSGSRGRSVSPVRARSRERSPRRGLAPPLVPGMSLSPHYQFRFQRHRSPRSRSQDGWRVGRRLSELSDSIGDLWRARYGRIDGGGGGGDGGGGDDSNLRGGAYERTSPRPHRPSCCYECKAAARCCCRSVDFCAALFFVGLAALVVLGYVHVYPLAPQLFFLALECSMELGTLTVIAKACHFAVSRQQMLYTCLTTAWLTVLLLVGFEAIAASGALRAVYSLDATCGACFTSGLCADTCTSATSVWTLRGDGANATAAADWCHSSGGGALGSRSNYSFAANGNGAGSLSGAALLVAEEEDEEESMDVGSERLVMDGVCNDGGTVNATELVTGGGGGGGSTGPLTATQAWEAELLRRYLGPAALGCCGYGSDCTDCGARPVPLEWDSRPATAPPGCSCVLRQLLQAVVREGLLEEALAYTVLWSTHAKRFIVDPRALLVLASCVACTFALLENLLSLSVHTAANGGVSSSGGRAAATTSGMATQAILAVPLHVSTASILALMLCRNRFRQGAAASSASALRKPMTAYNPLQILCMPVLLHSAFAVLFLLPPDEEDGSLLGFVPGSFVPGVAAGVVGVSCVVALWHYRQLDGCPRVDVLELKKEGIVPHTHCAECLADALGGCLCYCWVDGSANSTSWETGSRWTQQSGARYSLRHAEDEHVAKDLEDSWQPRPGQAKAWRRGV